MIWNAIVGASVTVISSIVVGLGPLGPVLGGGVAGYLEGESGVSVGVLSGVIASLPYALLIPVSGVTYTLVPEPLIVGVGLLVAAVIFVISLLINGVLGAVGGYLGVYLRSELADSG